MNGLSQVSEYNFMHIDKDDTIKMVEEFKRIANEIDVGLPWVQECYAQGGDTDMLVAIVVESVQAGRNAALG